MKRILTAVAALALLALTACGSAPSARPFPVVRPDVIPAFDSRFLIEGYAQYLKDLAALSSKDLLPGGSPLVGHYWQAGRQTPVSIVPNVLAVRGPRSLVEDGTGYIPGVLGEVNGAHPAMARMANAALYFVAVDPKGSPEIDALLDAPPGHALVGHVLLHPRPGDDPLTWGASVLTRQVVAVVRPEVVAGLSSDDARAELKRIAGPLGLDVLEDDELDADTFVFRAHDRDPREWLAAAQRFYADAACAGVAHPNLILAIEKHMQEVDPLLNEQWHIENTGQFCGSPGADINVRSAWTVTMGDPRVVIAVLEPDAVDLEHPDLKDRVAPGSRSVGDDRSTGPHATWVAGVAVASANDIGVRGVAPRCRFVSVAIGQAADEVWVAKLLRRAVLLRCRVVNLSWGYARAPGMADIVWHQIGRAALQGGCVIVASMPNYMTDAAESPIRSFVQHPEVIAVGRSTDTDRWGRCGYGACVDVVAPSGYAPGHWDPDSECVATLPGMPGPRPWGFRNIATTDTRTREDTDVGEPCTCQPDEPESGSRPCPQDDTEGRLLDLPQSGSTRGYTRCFRGTSAAAPQVSGAAALILSVRPGLSPKQVRMVIVASARKIPAPMHIEVAEGQFMDFPYVTVQSTGLTRNRTVGGGCLDVSRALELAMELPLRFGLRHLAPGVE